MKLSVVIGFKNWGFDRLALCLRLNKAALRNVDAEIVVSDLGSDDQALLRKTCDLENVKLISTPFEVGQGAYVESSIHNASGEFILTTDADIFFDTSIVQFSLRTIADKEAIFCQCRDLSQKFNEERLSEIKDLNYEMLKKNSTIRPRWGMGGFAVFRKSDWLKIRGFDERMSVYGAKI